MPKKTERSEQLSHVRYITSNLSLPLFFSLNLSYSSFPFLPSLYLSFFLLSFSFFIQFPFLLHLQSFSLHFSFLLLPPFFLHHILPVFFNNTIPSPLDNSCWPYHCLRSPCAWPNLLFSLLKPIADASLLSPFLTILSHYLILRLFILACALFSGSHRVPSWTVWIEQLAGRRIGFRSFYWPCLVQLSLQIFTMFEMNEHEKTTQLIFYCVL